MGSTASALRRGSRRAQPKLDLLDNLSTNEEAKLSDPELEFSDTRASLDDLPMEVLLEVTSYLPHFTARRQWVYDSDIWTYPYFDRPDALRALSQTCCILRRMVLPILWEDLDACASRTPWFVKQRRTEWPKLSKVLLKRGQGVLQSEELSKYVRTVNVSLARTTTRASLTILIRCLQTLPNVHTLQVIHLDPQMGNTIPDMFTLVVLPNVRKIVLPSHAQDLLRSCPEVRVIICNKGHGEDLVDTIATVCKKVEELDGFTPGERLMQRIINAAPNLLRIKFHRWISVSAIRHLANLQNLRCIEMHVRQRVDIQEFSGSLLAGRKVDGANLDDWIDAGLEALQGGQDQKGKRLKASIWRAYQVDSRKIRYQEWGRDIKLDDWDCTQGSGPNFIKCWTNFSNDPPVESLYAPGSHIPEITFMVEPHNPYVQEEQR